MSPTRTTDGSGEKPGIMGFSNFIGTLVIRVYGLADEVETGLDTEVKENRKVECDDLPQRRRHYQAHLQPAPGCGDSSGASFRGQGSHLSMLHPKVPCHRSCFRLEKAYTRVDHHCVSSQSRACEIN